MIGKTLYLCLLLTTLSSAASPSFDDVPRPAGIGIRLTIEGPVFVDASGMTLYTPSDYYLPVRSEDCTNRHDAVLLQKTGEGKVEFVIPAPDISTRRSCLEKHPPLHAPATVRPIGKWTIRAGEDGLSQWVYDGKALYTSIKDKVPGDVNGNTLPFRIGAPVPAPWVVATAPLSDVPPGVTANRTAAGLALATATGHTLYFAEHDAAGVGSADWQPFAAATLASTRLPDWSIVIRQDGLRQWAYKRKPLYTYSRDGSRGDAYFDHVFGGAYAPPVAGWHVALLVKAPSHVPPGVSTNAMVDILEEDPGIYDRVYTTADGKTLYTIHCVEDTADRLDCDDVGDSLRYWRSFCGGDQRCTLTWRPLPALPQARPIDGVWSVVAINSADPWMKVTDTRDALNVWAYRGRPVFSYAGDLRPGDHNAVALATGGFTTISAEPVLAYEIEDDN